MTSKTLQKYSLSMEYSFQGQHDTQIRLLVKALQSKEREKTGKDQDSSVCRVIQSGK